MEAHERDRTDGGVRIYRNSRRQRLRLHCGVAWGIAAAFLLAGIVISIGHLDADSAICFILAPIVAVAAAGMEFYRSIYVTGIVATRAGLEVETDPLGRPALRVLPWEARFSGEVVETVRGSTATYVTLRAPGVRVPLIIDTTVDPLDMPALERVRRLL